jgi:hypothetical protein
LLRERKKERKRERERDGELIGYVLAVWECWVSLSGKKETRKIERE